MYTIALDIGGTKIAGALIQNNNIRKKIKVPTQAKKGKNFVLKEILKVISLLLEATTKKQVKGIGIGMPGPLDPKKGVIISPNNLPGWRNIPLKSILQKKFRIKTEIENDARCAALAEAKYFDCKNLICLTLGTGVGCGIVINGKVYRGQGFAGELAHSTINFNGLKCNCKNIGCLEEYVSVRAIKRVARKYNLRLSPLELQKLARKGNKKAIKVYKEVGTSLGVGLANLVNIFNPDMVVINGGLSKAGNLLLQPAIKEMKKRAFKANYQGAQIIISKLQEQAGLLGAASLIK